MWVGDTEDLVGAAPLWGPRSYSADQEHIVAEAAAERIYLETGLAPSPRVVEWAVVGVRASLVLMFERVPKSGPLPGHSGTLGIVRLRRARRVLKDMLRDWTMCEEVEAEWMADLLTGHPNWDGPVVGSSAAWAARSFEPYVELPATRTAALGWARALTRLLDELDDSPTGRRRLSRTVRDHRLATGRDGAPGDTSPDGDGACGE